MAGKIASLNILDGLKNKMIKFKLSIEYRRKVQMFCILCLFPVFLNAQSSKLDASPKRPASTVVKTTKKVVKKTNVATKQTNQQRMPLIAPPVIALPKAKKHSSGKQLNLEHSETLSHDDFLNPDYQVLTGNVRFRHEGAYLYCDSAHYFQKTNSLYAYGNVHMEQGDTLFLYGAWLFYDGNSKLVMVREKVRLENRKVTLFTDSLNYDRVSNIGYFFDGGLLVNEDKGVTNELTSEYGQYSPETKIADFKHDVKLKHPKFVMTNQELTYNTTSGVANIFCPTEIVADSGYIYSENGWYDTKNDKSVLYKRSYILNNHRRLTGDTIHYDKKNGIGEAFGKVELIDSTQQMTFKGDYGYSVEKTEYALISKKALMIEHSTKDTLYLHADSLITQPDSTFKSVMAYHGVRFFRSDIQGLCDSLTYTTRDSLLNFYHKPILWSEQQQMTGEFMQLFTKNSKPDRLFIQKDAMAISMETDSLYNQLSGRDLIAYFDSSKVVRVEIKGNAETIFLPRDGKTNEIIGMNRLESSSLTIFLENEKMKKIIFWPQPKGKFYPLLLIPGDVRYLANFAWHDDVRPSSPEDVFRKIKVVEKVEDSSKGRQTMDSSIVGKEIIDPAKRTNSQNKAAQVLTEKKRSFGVKKQRTK